MDYDTYLDREVAKMKNMVADIDRNLPGLRAGHYYPVRNGRSWAPEMIAGQEARRDQLMLMIDRYEATRGEA